MTIKFTAEFRCDHCGAGETVDSPRPTRAPMPLAYPVGWRDLRIDGGVIQYCPACVEGLERFRQQNDAVEQSR
jgi:hypothetical protein